VAAHHPLVRVILQRPGDSTRDIESQDDQTSARAAASRVGRWDAAPSRQDHCSHEPAAAMPDGRLDGVAMQSRSRGLRLCAATIGKRRNKASETRSDAELVSP
jgi:hypothetical protein